MDDQYKQFPAALTAAREAAGLTQKELADRVGKTQQAVAKWENGESNPTRRSMGKLIAVLPELAKLNLPTMETAPYTIKTSGTMTVRSPGSFSEEVAEYSQDIRQSLPTEYQPFFEADRRQEFDYYSPRVAIELCFLYPAQLNPISLTRKLWRLSTARLRDKGETHNYYLLAVSMNDVLSYRQQMMLSKFAAEAELHGVHLLAATSASQAAQIIESIESAAQNPNDLTTFENFYEDGDPHG